MKIKRLLFICSIPAAGILIALGVLIFSGLKDQVGKADVALVLGNTVNMDGTPSLRLQARLDKTVELFRDDFFPIIIVSGGIGIEGYDEAKVMRDYLVSHGIPPTQIIMDSEGINTYASAKKTLQIIRESNKKSVFVISQYFHLPRARLTLERLGISPIYSAHANFFEWRDIYSSFREVAAYISYALCN